MTPRQTAFYCRCGARLVGSERVEHQCDLPLPDAIGPDPDAENDPLILDFETVCAWCARAHGTESAVTGRADCACKRHIDGGGGKHACNAAAVETA